MTLKLGNRALEFLPARIAFGDFRSTDLFGKKNNKTLHQTLLHPKYAHLASSILEAYSDSLGLNLGDFLLKLKRSNDVFYRCFLNRYGDACYCEFRLHDPNIAMLKGLYCFAEGGSIKYIGKSIDSFANRINNGYGRIHPKNCYRDGQATNCHLNALIADCVGQVVLFVCPMLDNQDIQVTEAALIAQEKPEWNIQLKGVSDADRETRSYVNR
jgi:hypothetical protein